LSAFGHLQAISIAAQIGRKRTYDEFDDGGSTALGKPLAFLRDQPAHEAAG
jgi:hypothetical protein